MIFMPKLSASLLFFSITFASMAQENLFDATNTEKFAEYLLQSGQYDFAVKEFERVVYLEPTNENAVKNLLKAYRLAGDYKTGILRSKELFENQSTMPRTSAVEYTKLLFSTRDWEQEAIFRKQQTNLTETDKVIFESTGYIFSDKFKIAQQVLALSKDTLSPVIVSYKNIVNQGLNSPRKSPFFAGLMSTAIPGLGKVYTGDWKDAIVSLIFTGGMAFQAIRNFNKHGIDNYRPWIYTTIGTGFYLGNIFGSVKSAKDVNRKRINRIQHEASDIFNLYY